MTVTVTMMLWLLQSALVVVVVSYAPHPTAVAVAARGRGGRRCFIVQDLPIKRSATATEAGAGAGALASWGRCFAASGVKPDTTLTRLYDTHTSTDVVPAETTEASSSSSSSSSSTTSTTATNELPVSPPPPPVSFVSEPQHVYIEDTDAYGIVLNSNYIKFYERALMMMTMAKTTTTMTSMIMMVGFKQQKFRSSPKLGDEYVIRGKYNCLKSDSDDGENNGTWDLEMTNVDGSIVYNTLSGAVLWSIPDSEDSSSDDIIENNKQQYKPSPPSRIPSVYNFTVWKDELDFVVATGTTPPLPRYVLPLHSSLNFFERPRSNLIGGPDQLKKLQDEDGVVVVVTSIEDCCHDMTNMIGRHDCDCDGGRDQTPSSQSSSSSSSLYPGRQILVETLYDVKRNGMIVDCYQTVLSPTNGGGDDSDDDDDDDDDTLLILTQGKVTVMMIDAETRRPTKRLPSWLKQNLGLDL